MVLLAPWWCFLFPVFTTAPTWCGTQKVLSLFTFTLVAATAPSPGGVRTETGRGHRQRPRLEPVEERDQTGVDVTMVLLLVLPLFVGVALQFALAPDTDALAFYDALGFTVGAVSCVTYGVVTWAPRRSP